MKKNSNFKRLYDAINGGHEYKTKSISPKCFTEAIKLNGFSVSTKNDSHSANVIYRVELNLDDVVQSEAISMKFEDKGGIIVFSTNVNALE